MDPIATRIEEQIGILERTAEAMSETARMIAIKATQVTHAAMELATHASRLFGQAEDLRRILAGLSGR